MKVYRLRAHLRFTKSSGLAHVLKDEMEVRREQSTIINDGKKNEERPYNIVLDDGDYEVYRADIQLYPKRACENAYDWIVNEENYIGDSVAFVDEETGKTSPGWIELHVCDHEEEYKPRCIIERKAYSPQRM